MLLPTREPSDRADAHRCGLQPMTKAPPPMEIGRTLLRLQRFDRHPRAAMLQQDERRRANANACFRHIVDGQTQSPLRRKDSRESPPAAALDLQHVTLISVRKGSLHRGDFLVRRG